MMPVKPTYEELEQRIKELETEAIKHKNIDRAFRESEERFRTLSEATFEGIAIHEGGVLLTANEQYFRMFGYDPQELIGQQVIPLTVAPLSREFIEKQIKSGVTGSHEIMGLKKDGTEFPIETNVKSMEYQGRLVRVVAIRNISERNRTDKELIEGEERYRTILDSNPDPAVIYDMDGKVVYLNPAFTSVFGWTQEERLGKKMDNFIPEEEWPILQKLFEEGNTNACFLDVESRRYTKEGKILDVSISGAFFKDSKGMPAGSYVTLRNITENKKMEKALRESEEKFRRLSYMDDLTGVANRRYFEEIFNVEWGRGARDRSPMSLIMCDIDFFKAYNDRLGHQSGDDALKQVADLLRSTLRRPGDMAARYGGEEFVVVLPDTDKKGAALVAELLRANVEVSGIAHPDSPICKSVTISIGVATTIPGGRHKPASLISKADHAMYQAKKEGRNRVKISD
ncbi:MAG: diguanylate cyclase [Thermodesulfobacteriota bacterium]